MKSPHRLALAACILANFLCGYAQAHNPEARYVERMPWQREHFSKVLGLGYSELGLDMDQSRAEIRQVGADQCIVGTMIGLDVDDNYAFDIDEPVDLTITYAGELTAPVFAVLWNKNGGNGEGRIDVRAVRDSGLHTITLTLDRARFAGAGTMGIDIAIGISQFGPAKVALCDVSIKRSGKTKPLPAVGGIHLQIVDDATGEKIPARAGLYDVSGRAPLPSDEAVLVERFADRVRQLPMNAHPFWPSANRVFFYVNGEYHAQIPAGRYELAASRGPEYHTYYSTVDVAAGQTRDVVVRMKRYADMRAEGWYSGDSHIHLGRDETRDKNVWAQVAAEDVQVGNLLQMGSIASTYFLQPEWGKPGRFEQEGTAVVSGEEDPRTGQLGHTIHHNLIRPNHQSEDTYFLYQRVFEDVARQGGVSGYAHLRDLFHVRRGLALDVPFGLVSFMEILQAGRLATDIWYDFLNLGYRITPAGGSDYPYTDLPGTDRNYVKVEGKEDTDAWFKAFKTGHVYVSNGPFLEFTINGKQMGDELRVERGGVLNVQASVRLNPDVDRLDRLELIVEGEVVQTQSAYGKDRIDFKTTLKADHSQWIAVRAWGYKQQVFNGPNATGAHSAPIYVVVGDEPTWNRALVPVLVAREKAALNEIRTAKIIPDEDLEHFSTDKILVDQWPKQREQLLPRVAEAEKRYDDLLVKLAKYEVARK